MGPLKLRQFLAEHPPDVLIPPEVQQRIVDLAYILYEQKGRQAGQAISDCWREAERVILGRRGKVRQPGRQEELVKVNN